MSAWSFPQGVLKLFPWTKDFIPSTLRQTSAPVWIRIHGLSQEYWRPKIVFAITCSIGTPICIDSASNNLTFERPFGHFVRVLVDLDLTKDFVYKVLVERVGFAFFVDLEHEKVPEFCSLCIFIGHNAANCKKKEQGMKGADGEKKNPKGTDVKGKKVVEVLDVNNTDNDNQGKDKNKDKESTREHQPNTFLGETSKDNNNGNSGEHHALVNFVSRHSPEDEGHTDSEYIDATQVVDLVSETQIPEAQKLKS